MYPKKTRASFLCTLLQRTSSRSIFNGSSRFNLPSIDQNHRHFFFYFFYFKFKRSKATVICFVALRHRLWDKSLVKPCLVVSSVSVDSRYRIGFLVCKCSISLFPLLSKHWLLKFSASSSQLSESFACLGFKVIVYKCIGFFLKSFGEVLHQECKKMWESSCGHGFKVVDVSNVRGRASLSTGGYSDNLSF